MLRNNFMAISKEFLNSVYVSLFARPMDVGGHNYWLSQPNMSEDFLLDCFQGSDEYLRIYGTLSDEGKITKLYQVILGREVDADGLKYWNDELTKTFNGHFPKLAMQIIAAATNNSNTDKVAINNKFTAATLFTDKLLIDENVANKYAMNTNEGVAFIHGIDENTNYEKIVVDVNNEISKIANQASNQGGLFNTTPGLDYADANYSTHGTPTGDVDDYFKFTSQNDTVIADVITLPKTTLKDENIFDNDVVHLKISWQDTGITSTTKGKSTKSTENTSTKTFVMVDADSRWENIETLKIISSNASGNIILSDSGYISGLKTVELAGHVGDNGLNISAINSAANTNNKNKTSTDTVTATFSTFGVTTIDAYNLLNNDVSINVGYSETPITIYDSHSNNSTITGGKMGDDIYLNANHDVLIYDKDASDSTLVNMDKVHGFNFLPSSDKIYIPEIVGTPFGKLNTDDKGNKSIIFRITENLNKITEDNLTKFLKEQITTPTDATQPTGTQVGILQTKDLHNLLVIDVNGDLIFENDNDVVIEVIGYTANVNQWESANFLDAIATGTK